MLVMGSLLDKHAKILAIIGPSGVGKAAIVRRLTEDGLVQLTPSWTTQPRPTDEAGDEYEHRFCTEEVFSQKEQNGDFFEVVQPVGSPYRYGFPPLEVPPEGHIPLVMLRAMFLDLLHRYYPNTIIYQVESDEEQVRESQAVQKIMGDYAEDGFGDYSQELQLGRMHAGRVFENHVLPETTAAIVAAIRQDFGPT